MPSQVFLPKYFESVGGDAGIFGLAMGISAIPEVPVFYFGSRLIGKFSPPILILGAMVMFFFRMLICILFPSVPAILVSMALQGFGYSLFLTSSLVYDPLAEPSCKAAAFLLGSATYSGLSGILGNMAGGAIIENLGIMALFQTGGLLTFSMMLLFGFSPVGDFRKKP